MKLHDANAAGDDDVVVVVVDSLLDDDDDDVENHVNDSQYTASNDHALGLIGALSRAKVVVNYVCCKRLC